MAAGATCIVDTAFGAGAGFLRAWRTYADAPFNTGLLHYVALVESAHWPNTCPLYTSDAADE